MRKGGRRDPCDNLGYVKNLLSYVLLGSLCMKEIPVQGGGLVCQMPMQGQLSSTLSLKITLETQVFDIILNISQSFPSGLIMTLKIIKGISLVTKSSWQFRNT